MYKGFSMLTLFAFHIICSSQIAGESNKGVTSLSNSMKISEISGSINENILYAYNGETNTLQITGSGEMPDMAENNDNWSSFKDSIQTINIDDQITSIGAYSFYNLTNLASIHLPSQLTSIGSFSFYGCINLNSIILSEKVTTIGICAFAMCTHLTSFEISQDNQIYKIIDNVIYSKDGSNLHFYLSTKEIDTFTVPNEVTTIKQYSFYKCTNLINVEMIDNVLDIESYAFAYSSIYSIQLSEKITQINPHTFDHCTNLNSTNIPSGVVSIGDYSFDNCRFESISIPDTVETIGSYAFNKNGILKSVDFGKEVRIISEGAFYRCGIKSLTIPNKTTVISMKCFYSNSNLKYVFLHDNLKTIGEESFQYCSLSRLDLPESLVEIEQNAFSFNDFDYLYIPGNVKKISFYAFSHCDDLISADIDDGVGRLFSYTLDQCNSLTSVSIGSVSTIESEVIRKCSSLKSLIYRGNYSTASIDNTAFTSIPFSINVPVDLKENLIGGRSTVRSISSGSCGNKLKWYFNSASGELFIIGRGKMQDYTLGQERPWEEFLNTIKNITIKKGVTSIGEHAFSGCEKLENVFIEENVSFIGYGAFSSCPSLLAINASKNNEYYKTIDDILYSKDGTKLICYPSGKVNTSFTVPLNVVSINDYAFSESNNLVLFEVLGTISSIGNCSFHNCANLETVIFINPIDPTYETHSFIGCYKLKAIFVSVNYDKDTFCGQNVDKSIFDGVCGDEISFYLLHNILTILGSGKMDNYSLSNLPPWDLYKASIKEVSIRDNLTTIGDYAFKGCSSLTSIELPNGMTYIGDFSFEGCNEIQSFTIPSTVNLIGTGAFLSCSQLESFSVTKNPKYFYYAQNGVIYSDSMKYLTAYPCAKTNATFDVPDSVVTIETYAFSKCKYLISVSFGKKLANIREHAFAQCYNLANISFARCIETDSGITIYDYAFCDCSIESLNFSKYFTIKNYCFCNCKIESLNISNKVRGVGIGAFKNCSLLTTVYIGDYIYAIEDHTFESTGLLSIVLPDNIFRIGISAFANCINLSTVEISDAVSQIGDFAFQGCTNLSSLVYNGTSLPEEGTNWFDGCISLKSVRVPLNFENETFCGISLEKIYAYGKVENLMNWFIDAPSGIMTLSGKKHNNGFSPTKLPPWDSIKEYIKEIIILDTIDTIKSYSFAGCPNLQKLINIEPIKSIEKFAFSQCDNLEIVKIHKNITNIGEGAFHSCSKLERFEVDPNNTKFKDIDGILYNDTGKLLCYPAGKKDATIAFNGYVYAYSYSFGSCKNIETIFFSEYMFLQPNAFVNCTSLTNIYYNSTQGMFIKNTSFVGCPNLKSIKVRFGYSTVSTDDFEIDECFSLGNYENAYYNFSKYTGNLTIFGSGDFILSDNSHFEPFKQLIENLIVEEGIVSFEGVIVQNATNLKTVELCDSLKVIGSLVFRGCSSLTTVYIPKNVTNIDYDTFLDCRSLQSIEVSSENMIFTSENGVLYYNSNDKKLLRNYPAGKKGSSFAVPSDVSVIGSYAFNYCNNLVSVEINQIESIYSSAFYYCSNLSSVTYLGSYVTYNSNAFNSCDHLGHVNVLPNYLNKTFYGKRIQIIEIQSSNEIDESQPSSYEEIQSSKTDENIESSSEKVDDIESSSEKVEDIESSSEKVEDIESSSEKVEDIESSSEKVDDTQNSSFNENTNSIDTDESKSVVQEETSDKVHKSSSIEIIDSTINNEVSTSSSEFIDPVQTTEPTPSEVIVGINVSDNANDAELDQKLKDQFEKLSNKYDKNVNKVVVVSSSKIEFNSNLTDDQFIKINGNDAKINYKGGNMNLVLDNTSKITISVDKEDANITLKGEGEINFEQTDSNVDSINITKSSNINGSVKITVSEKVNQLTIDSIKFESKCSISILKENNENPVHFSIKNIETTSNAIASISNVTVLNSLNLIQSSTINLDNVTLKDAIIKFDIFDYETQNNNNWKPFFQGNFNNPPSKLVLNKLENSKDIHPILNHEYTFVTGMFDDNQCEKWLESIDYGDSDFNTKNCLLNQLLSAENKRIVMKATSSDNKGNKLSGGQIAGIVIGCIAGVAIIAVAIFFIIKRKKNTKSDNEDSVNDDPTDL